MAGFLSLGATDVLGPITLGAGATSAQRDTQQRPGFCPLGSSSNPSRDNRKHLQTLLNVPRGAKSFLLESHCFRGLLWKAPQGTMHLKGNLSVSKGEDCHVRTVRKARQSTLCDKGTCFAMLAGRGQEGRGRRPGLKPLREPGGEPCIRHG